MDTLPHRPATPEDPLRVLTSGCLAGHPCGVDGTSYGTYPASAAILALPNVRRVAFCPEDFAFGTPRALCDIHGGDGFDVLDGRARVLTDRGDDWTRALVAAADRMLAIAVEHRVELAILMDMSAACGSQVVSDGARGVPDRRFTAGVGVCTARLRRAGIPVVSQRDFRTLGELRARLDPGFVPDPAALDHHETDWYRATFP